MGNVNNLNSRGVIFIHSAPVALCRHIEWALGAVLATNVQIDWTPQPAERGSLRAELTWTGPKGASAALASALRGCQRVRFEVTEDRAGQGLRYSYTPTLGFFRAQTNANGDIVVDEQRLRELLASGMDLRAGIQELLAYPWDSELEVFRHAAEGVRWLHRAG